MAATGPTNLPPRQSEVQRVTVEGDGGMFKLAFEGQETVPVAFDAPADELQSALEALPGIGTRGVRVTGGPGGAAEHPYFVDFDGALAEMNVEELTARIGELHGEHPFVHVFTTLPGGPGTGEITINATNIGDAASSGVVTVSLGPLPSGVVTTGPAVGTDWECPAGAGESTVTCRSTDPVSSLNPANGIIVPIQVRTNVPFTGSAHVEVSSASAGSDSFHLPIVVSREEAGPGGAAVWAAPFDENGDVATQAGSHPFAAATFFLSNTVRAANGKIIPVGDPKEVIVDLPPGFGGNPMVTARCPQSQLTIPNHEGPPLCGSEMVLGNFQPIIHNFGEASSSYATPFFNDIPAQGYAAEFTTKIAAPLQTLLASVRSEDDYGVRITAPNNPNIDKIYGAYAALEGVPAAADGKAFLALGSDCAEEARRAPTVVFRSNTFQRPTEYWEARSQQSPVTGCDRLHFEAYDPQTGKGQVSFGFQPTSTQGSSAVGMIARLHVDQSGLTDPKRLATPALKRSVVRLPRGLDINPSQANGLEACSETQAGYMGAGFELPNPMRFNEAPVACPDGSKLGTAEAISPLLDEPLKGTVYLARQEENPYGSLVALYLVLESERFGLRIKLPGKVDLDSATGQVTASFDYLPQQPVEGLTLRFRGGGPRSEFATPEVCGTYSTDGEWEPWSAPESGPPAITHDRFTVANNCAGSAATRPFSPSFEAGTGNPIAGAYAPLVIKVGRNDGEQELRSLDFSLPPGVSGKLAGIPYCSDAQIAAAEGKTGRAELASPSCPAASELGTVDTAAGVGSEPFHVQGHAYLAGPYKGAPVSSVVITPAVAGPFDLGDVVIRAPVYVNPETAELTAKSDPIPTILKGIPLKVRAVTINIDRSQFGINPTNCEAMTATASIGSSNGATATPANRFQVGGCENLAFKPKLQVKLKGGTRRNAKPALTAILRQAPGQANIKYTSVALPHSEFLEQGHIKTICTRVQFAAQQCPKGSIYGRAEAVTPLLDQPLRGPVYLRSSSHRLPDMVVALRGPATQPIEIDLDGRIDSLHGGIRTTFEAVPDAPVSKFVLRMRGGKKSLIVNSTNICRGKHKVTVRMNGQNGRRHNFLTPLKAQCGKKKAKKHKGHHKQAKKHGRGNRRGKK